MVRIGRRPPSRAAQLASVTGVMGVMAIPRAARVYIGCALLGAAGCVLFTLSPGAQTPWGTVALLAALYAGCELPGRCPLLGRALGGSVPLGAGSFFPVLLASALLLPPSAAALTALPGALLSRVEQRPAGVRRLWRAGQLVLAVWTASLVAAVLSCDDVLGHGTHTPTSRTSCCRPGPPRSPSAWS